MRYAALQSEFDAEETIESQIVHAADKLDILFQTIAYHNRGYPKRMLSDLWMSTIRSVGVSKIRSVNELRKIAVQLYKAAT